MAADRAGARSTRGFVFGAGSTQEPSIPGRRGNAVQDVGMSGGRSCGGFGVSQVLPWGPGFLPYLVVFAAGADKTRGQ